MGATHMALSGETSNQLKSSFSAGLLFYGTGEDRVRSIVVQNTASNHAIAAVI